MTDTVLVTGAFGLVGSATVRRLIADGHRVVATDLDTPANRKAAAALPAGVTVRWADLTDPAAVGALVSETAPSAIVHLAAVIPPFIYQRRSLAEKVNVGATATLLAAAEKLAGPPRFVLASSVAVYGSRNPHTQTGLLTSDTPVNPADIYGDHKVRAEALVRSSALDWVILRLGGVLTANPGSYVNMDNFFFEGMLPTDGRLQTVDVRDVASAFAAATTADAVGETLLIGGDGTHRLLQGEVAAAMAAAMGLVGGLPTGLKGDPRNDDGWFATDWMDTARAQEALGFQHHSWPQMLIETAENAGIKRPLLRLIAPLARQILQRRTAYHGTGRRYADPWEAIKAKWGDPRPDGSRP
ncbi:nucleoside-diphosphate-sugar epimerase [Mycolicibacterium canariasense]|uniref:Nucleoside-diphosphate-sugar epimerase n=1 Tax=Mycolicibacterium canariasense TaxID=228230 RepID=A0A124E2N6_MYCCR|nr:NAD(P)-dependent oxidoreductase [Mycolicibacterium canariasense]MCV7210956.1 NAD(P)-dependent oxidoreductase [Mycolicibacterium canariasense]ORV01495.1 oxidoreductase [Mycolicibacterium canariasense]GAS97380.1 nucleoside-diphosphate-sugar epimerase [Mycolicibacterium canariasense]